MKYPSEAESRLRRKKMSGITGVSVDSFLTRGMSKVDGISSKLEAKMQEISSGGKEMKQEDLLMLQYEMGQYQAYMTTLNNTVQSIQNQVKDLAKSIH
jgi:uncharacterized protein YlxW (UPF0749 family)